MKSQPSPGGIAGLIMCVLAIGFALYEFTAARRAESSLAVANQTHQADQAQLQELTQSARVAAQKQADLQKIVEQQQHTVAEGTPATLNDQATKAAQAAEAARTAKKTALADGQAFVASYTQSREMLMDIGKAQVRRNFAQFYLTAGLSPAQIEALENQTAAHWIETAAVTPKSIHPDEADLSDDQMKGILGEQGFQQLQDFKRLQPLQGMVNDISSLSPFAPLSPTQFNQLLGIMASASSSYQGGGKADPQSIDWNQVSAQAQGILSEPQITALKAEAQLPQLMVMIKQFYQNQPPAK